MSQDKPNTKTDISKNNHTIPRMMLNRFASRNRGEEFHVWQFRSGAKPFENNTRKASAISFFYGTPANGVEQSFSVVENHQSDMLNEILAGADPQEHEENLRRFVWILAIRTSSFRSNIQDVFSGGLDEMIAQADDETIMQWLPGRLDAEFDTMLDELIDKLPAVQARAFRISLERRPSLRTKLRQWIDVYLGSTDINGDIQSFLSAVRSQLDMTKLTKDAHVNSFEKIPQIDHAPDSFRPQHWQLIRAAPQSVILGDGACFAVDDTGEPGHLLRFTKQWTEIYLPIAHDAVLVASKSDEPKLLSINDINRASAALSYDQFFAARSGEDEQSLQSLIRTGTAAMTADEMVKSAQDTWRS